MGYSDNKMEKIIKKVAWNKGLTKETDERIRKYSEKNKGKKRTDDSKIRMGLIHKGKKPWNKGLSKKITKLCKVCNILFYVLPRLNNRKKFCSMKCRKAQWYKIEKQCVICKKDYYIIKSQIRKNRTCSKKCFDKLRIGISNEWLKNGIIKICTICNKEYYISQSRIKRSNFCSYDCYYKSIIGKPSWNKGLTRETDERVNIGSIKTQTGLIKLFNSERGKEIKKNIREKRLLQIFPKKDSSIEIKFQKELKKRNIEFITHKVIKDIEKRYQCDIFIEPNIIIECDGIYWHDYPNGTEIDRIRTKQMQEKGYVVFRFWENEINQNVSLCVDKVQKFLKNR